MAAVTAALCSTLLFVGLFVFVSADQKNITAESGQNVTLTCRVLNNINSNDIIEWSRADLETKHVLVYRNGKIDPDNQHPSFKNRVDLQDTQMKDGNVSLILKNVTINDAGTYECRVQREGDSMKPISIINLNVTDPPDQPRGLRESGGKEEDVKEDRSVGLIVGLSVPAVLFVAAAVGFLIYKKCKQQSQGSYQPPAEQQPV